MNMWSGTDALFAKEVWNESGQERVGSACWLVFMTLILCAPVLAEGPTLAGLQGQLTGFSPGFSRDHSGRILLTEVIHSIRS